MRSTLLGLTVLLSVLVVACFSSSVRTTAEGDWSAEEIAILRSLWIGSLPPLPPDPSNRYADDTSAAELGKEFFFDTRFSATGTVSCGTCHQPEHGFQDDLPRGKGVAEGGRRTMPIQGTAYSPWLFWDGRKDKQWAQALGPLENPVEHGGDRTMYVRLLSRHYRSSYERLFGPLPDTSSLPLHAGPISNDAVRANWEQMPIARRDSVTRAYVNMGKAIAAFERRLQFGPSRFDRYVEGVIAGDAGKQPAGLTREEIGGLRLFIGKGNCVTCHNGPLFTDNSFHNTGVPVVPGLPSDDGRATGARQVATDEFNCASPYSDDTSNCDELRFITLDDPRMVRAYKPPTLRGVAARPPYMHAGQFATLARLLEHYNIAPSAPAGHSELKPLGFNQSELRQLEAFLRTLDAPVAGDTRMSRALR